MKTRTRLLLIASATTLLASCASMDDRTTLTPGYEGKMVNDMAYVSAVESLAASRGVRVEWVNPPKVKPHDED